MADRSARILIPITRAVRRRGCWRWPPPSCAAENGSGMLLGVVELPQGVPSPRADHRAALRSLLQRLTRAGDRAGRPIQRPGRVASTVARACGRPPTRTRPDLIIRNGRESLAAAVRPNVDDLVAEPAGDLLLVRPDPPAPASASATASWCRSAAAPPPGWPARGCRPGRPRRVPLTALHVHDPRHEDRRQRDPTGSMELLLEFGAAWSRRGDPQNPQPGHHGGRPTSRVTVLARSRNAARSSVLVGRAWPRRWSRCRDGDPARARAPSLRSWATTCRPESRSAQRQSRAWWTVVRGNTFHSRESATSSGWST